METEILKNAFTQQCFLCDADKLLKPLTAYNVPCF